MESRGRSVHSQVFLPPKDFPPAKVATISGVGLMLPDVFRFFHKENRRRFAREWQQNRSRIAREVTTQVVFCPKKPVWLGTIVGGMMPSVRP